VVDRLIGHVLGVEVGFNGLEIHNASRDDSGSDSSARELKLEFENNFQLLLQLDKLNGRH
jgi:hypothetical protein